MKRPLTLHDHVRIHTILFVLGAAIIVIGSTFSEPLNPHWLMWVGIVIFLSSPAYRLLKIKCPHCGSKLLSCQVMPKYCPDCGNELALPPEKNKYEEK